MDVKISYGTNLKKVPEKIKDLVRSCVNQLHDAIESCEISISLIGDDVEYNEMVLKILDKARLRMASVDRTISDSQLILGGYVDANKPVEEKATQPEKVNVD